MSLLTPRLQLLYTTLLVMVLAGAGHIHGHICLDGQEPQTQLHFENLGDHPEHHEDASHRDYEQELNPQLVAGKLLKLNDLLVLLPSVVMLVESPGLPVSALMVDAARYFPPQAQLLPPSHAPPPYSSQV